MQEVMYTNIEPEMELKTASTLNIPIDEANKSLAGCNIYYFFVEWENAMTLHIKIQISLQMLQSSHHHLVLIPIITLLKVY